MINGGVKPLVNRTKSSINKLILIICIVAATAAAIGIYKSPYIVHEMSVVKDFSNAEYFPLTQGSYWIYSFERKSLIDGKTISKKGTLRMQVLRMYDKPGYSLAVIKGDPLRCDPNVKYGLLIWSNKVYYVGDEIIDQVEQRVKNKKELSLNGDAKGTALQFEFPLFKGLSWQPWDHSVPDNDKYCWIVDNEQYLQFGKGKHPQIYHAYWLRYATNPDITKVRFVPEIGIFSVSYMHHGTPDDYEVILKGYEKR